MSLSLVKHLFAHSSKSRSLPRSMKSMGGLPRQEADRSSTPCWTGCVYTPTPIEMTPLSVSMTKRLDKVRPRHRESTKLRLAKAVSSCSHWSWMVGNSSPRASQHKACGSAHSFNLPPSLASPKSSRQPAIRGFLSALRLAP
ncbi:hypothetical protein PISMIDRAFT_275956 [Pisolithus microcarpus 441]|uniref:Uncharacterized protein n=1 Tax=Pisolithus microcarpus 441 TaxID=765257 RepID=A0A0C9Z8H5_9AGAM|nr:hypothetical protein BKA83DRAFT_275956 [Pisolithus microcarpus]KIK16173.1 hypothetical protein PISMIDRAFT_275956 [Pisolithus microcarpus 441]